MTTIMLVKDAARGCLRPATTQDAVTLDRLDSRKHFTATLKQARNPQRLRLYWQLLRAVSDSHSFYALAGADALHDFLKLRLGLVDCVVYHDGSTRIVPKSIAFDAMGETEFKDYLDRVLTLIETEILPGVDRADLLREASDERRTA
jgi:hypothetical protein